MTAPTSPRSPQTPCDPRPLVDAELAALAIGRDEQQRLRARILKRIGGLSRRFERLEPAARPEVPDLRQRSSNRWAGQAH